MKTLLEEIGKGYRRQAKEMLSIIEAALPDLDIYKYLYTCKGSRLHAFKKISGNQTMEIIFTAHPAAGYVEIKSRLKDAVLYENRCVPVARIHLRQGADLKATIEKVLIGLSIIEAKQRKMNL